MIEIQILKNKILINSTSPVENTKLINLLKQFGIEIEVIIKNITCG